MKSVLERVLMYFKNKIYFLRCDLMHLTFKCGILICGLSANY